MICNWSSSKELCNCFSNMLSDINYSWKDIEITWEDNNIDYYVIINFPQEGQIYIPEKTLIFQMEPSVAYKNWGEWAYPDANKFLFVGTHKKCLNLVQVQFKKIPIIFPTHRLDRIVSILSSKNHDDGHRKRISFIRNTESRGINHIDVYGMENYHNFFNYNGKVIDDSKEKIFELYKYVFQAENNAEHNYASEKIWEPIICECLCFYWGCPNLEDYIDPLSFVRLDLDDIEGSIKIINKAIEEDWWSQRIGIIRKEKHRIIHNLSFFPFIKNIIDTNFRC